MTQTERVVEYIREFGSITPLEAMRDLGIMRLASRISEIKDKYPIVREMVAVKNRYGETTHIARYRLEAK